MIKITKDKLYKLDRLRQGIVNQEYLVDGKDIYIGNPYGNITFVSKYTNSTSKDFKINGQNTNKNITIPTPTVPVIDDTAYGVSWNTNLDGASKNALYDKFEADTTYNAATYLTIANAASTYLPLAGGTLTGNLLFSADNTKDIGASGATRPRTGYFGTNIIVGSGVNIGTTATPIGKLSIPVAPTISANCGLVNLGNGAFDGSTSGYFGTSSSSNANGTLLAGNLISGSTSDLLNLQRNGNAVFRIINTGASSIFSLIMGSGNSASGAGAIAIGFGNTASNNRSMCISDQSTVSATYGGIFAGSSNTVSSSEGFIGGGNSNSISAQGGVSLGGFSNKVTGKYGISSGTLSVAYLYSQRALGTNTTWSSGGTNGNAQLSQLVSNAYPNLTTGGTSILSLDGTGTTNLIIPRTSNAWNVKIKTVATVVSIVGTATGVTVGDIYGETKELIFKRLAAGTSSIVGSVNTVYVNSDASMATTAITVTAGASQEMKIEFKAPTFAGGGTVQFKVVSSVELTEIY